MQRFSSGFTLIELAIVLVIVGLVVGGILSGRELIAAADLRATTAQMQRYALAVNNFRGKYGYLPGDIPNPLAAQNGFITRGSHPGWGDGNQVIQGSTSAGGYNMGYAVVSGETAVAWVDLSTARMIQESFSQANFGSNLYPTTGNLEPRLRLPEAKMGRGNYFYISSGYTTGGVRSDTDGTMWLGLSAVENFTASNWRMDSRPGLRVKEAQALDSKVDDGRPQAGRIQAFYYDYGTNNGTMSWAAGTGEGANSSDLPTTAATTGSSTTCYDNGGAAGLPQSYSMTQDEGNGMNCAVSFRFQ